MERQLQPGMAGPGHIPDDVRDHVDQGEEDEHVLNRNRKMERVEVGVDLGEGVEQLMMNLNMK